MAELFGFQIKRKTDEVKELPSFAPPLEDDGAMVVAAGGVYGTYVDLDGTIRSEAELVTRYRDMALHPEVDAAVDDIVNDSIVIQDQDETVELILDEMEQPDNIKELITNEFKNILTILEFDQHAYEIFRKWYVDGRIYYHAIIDEKVPQEGIKELRYIDPRKIRKVREVTKKKMKNDVSIQATNAEYYVYNDKGFSNKSPGTASYAATGGSIRIAKDSIIHVTSGLTSVSGDMVLGYLHKAIKPLNQLRALEDATVIYRISRAPERRIFYIDVGNLPKMKAEQYLRDIMTRFKNKLVYDQTTGEIRDDRKFMTMLEDFWLPRREGGKGTEITTLPAGQNLGEMGDVEYFQNKLYKSLNVPIGRLQSDQTFNFGRATEISRDEVKFAKFLKRLRAKFSGIFMKLLERQLILKQIITSEDWAVFKNQIKFRFAEDNHFEELKMTEIMNDRVNLVRSMDDYAGKYVSHTWIRKTILKQSDEDIEEMDEQIAEEMQDPQYQMMPQTEPGGQPPQQQ